MSGRGCLCCCHSTLSQVAAELPAAVTSASHKDVRLGMAASSNPMHACNACYDRDAKKLSNTASRPPLPSCCRWRQSCPQR